MGDEPALKRLKPNKENSQAAFQCPAQAVFTFHLLGATSRESLAAEIEAGGAQFEGEFFHQHFGEEEVIRGFEGLSVNVWISAVTYHTWIDIKWSKRRPGADKVKEIMAEHFPKACASKEALISQVLETLEQADDMFACGEVMEVLDTSAQGQVTFVKYQLAAQGCTFVQALHERLQPLLLFFIDGASLIDSQDPKWELLLAVKRANQEQRGGHIVMGMQTLYNFWAYPERGSSSSSRVKTSLLPLDLPAAPLAQAPSTDAQAQPTPGAEAGAQAQPAASTAERVQAEGRQLDVQEYQRLRLSQALVLPPYQGSGIGKKLLELAYRMAATKNCLDLTLEDPSPNMNRMREKLEVEMVMGLPWVMEQVQEMLSLAAQSPSPSLAPPTGLLSQIKDHLKIHRKQLRVVWEAVMYLQPSVSGSEGMRAALDKLIRARVETESFGPCGAEAELKKVHDLTTNTDMKAPFIMMRTKKETASSDKPAAAAASATPDGTTEAELSATGRLSVVMMSTKDKDEAVQRLLDERVEQLETLARLLRPRAHVQREGRLTVPVVVAVAGEGKAADGAKVAAHVLAEVV